MRQSTSGLTLANKSRLPDGQRSVVLLVATCLIFAVVGGVVVGLGNLLLLLPLLAIFGFILVLLIPVTLMLWFMIIALFIVLGPVVYFSRFTQLQWLPPLIGVVFLVHVLFHSMHSKTYGSIGRRIPGFIFPLVLFLMLILLSTILDYPSVAEMLNSARFYFFMWPVMLIFMLGIAPPETISKIWKALLGIALLQVPFAIYQFIFVAKISSRLSPWDAVVGTFPGNIEGGGQSAAMGLTLLFAMLLAIALWRSKMLKGIWTMLIVLSSVFVLGLAEVKAVVLLLPLAVVLYYRRELLKKPIESIFYLSVAMILMIALFAGYQAAHYESIRATGNPNQPTDIVERVLRPLNADTESKREHQLGRITHLVFWWDNNVRRDDMQHALFGYGIGATEISNLGIGEIARRYPYAMDVTSTVILLWETGIFGHLLYLMVLLSGAWLSGRIARNPEIPVEHQIYLRVGAVALLLLAMTLLYKDFALRSFQIQFLIMLMLGQAGYWYRQIKMNK